MAAEMTSSPMDRFKRIYFEGYKYRSKLRSLPPHIREKIESIRPGDVCVDCGANVGSISGMFADLGAVTHAFEPDPAAFAELTRKASANKKIIPYPSAVGVAEGTAKLFFHKNREANSVAHSKASSLLGSKPNVSSECVEVAVCDLSALLKGLPRVKILKIDIEGFETELIPHLIATRSLDSVEVVYVETHEHKWPELREATAKMHDAVNASTYKGRIFFDWP
jgi:FkbM family methyltransferase